MYKIGKLFFSFSIFTVNVTSKRDFFQKHEKILLTTFYQWCMININISFMTNIIYFM